MMEIEVQPWTVRGVSQADAWNTRPGFGAAYLVDCERLNEAPERRVET